MSLFAAGAAAARADPPLSAHSLSGALVPSTLPSATSGGDARLAALRAAPFVPPPAALSFASAPNLAAPPAAESASGGVAQPVARTVEDLTEERDRPSQRRAAVGGKKKKRQRHRSRSSSRSNSRPRKKKKKKHRSKREHTRRQGRDKHGDRSGSPASSSSDSEEVVLLPRPLVSRADPAAVAAVSLATQPSVAESPPMQLDSDTDDAAELKESLRAGKAAQLAAEEEDDRRKILAIEQRLKDESTRGSYLHPLLSTFAGSRSFAESGHVVDTRGDLNNIMYESIYRLDIPAYTRAGGDLFLLGAQQVGLTTYEQVRALLARRGPGEPVRVRTNAAAEAKERLRFRASQRYFHERWSLRERDRTLRRWRRRRSTVPWSPRDPSVETEDFIPLRSPSQKEPAVATPSDVEAVSPQEAEGESFEEWAAAVTRDYNVALRMYPRNVRLWLQYVRAQEVLMQPTRRVHSGHALAEKQLAILERAIEANPRDEELHLALLQRALLLWPAHQVDAYFSQLAHDLPDSLAIMRAYLEFKSGSFCGPNMMQQLRAESSGIADAFAGALGALQLLREKLQHQFEQGHGATNAASLHERITQLRRRRRELNDALLDILSRYFAFLLHTGYTERAVALWQLVIEFNCFRPPTGPETAALPGGPLASMDSFAARDLCEAFFDSDVARFGESNAMGFANWHAALVQGEPSDPISDPQVNESLLHEAQVPPLPVLAWLRLESALDDQQWFPLRDEPLPPLPPFESEHSSLHRVVLYGELRDLVVDFAPPGTDDAVVVAAETALMAHAWMLSGLAALLCLPPRFLLPPGGMLLDSLVAFQNGRMIFRAFDGSASSNAACHCPNERFERLPGVVGLPFGDLLVGPLVAARKRETVEDFTLPSTGAYAPLDLDKLRDTSASESASIRALLSNSGKVELVRNSFKQMMSAFPDSDILRTSWLSFEYAISAANAETYSRLTHPGPNVSSYFSVPRELIKGFLRADPLNVALICHYALLEFHYGFEDTAIKLLSKTLTALAALPAHTQSSFGPMLYFSLLNVQITRAYRLPMSDPTRATLLRHGLHICLCASGNMFVAFDAEESAAPPRPTTLVKARKAFLGTVAGEDCVATNWRVPLEDAKSSVSGLSLSPAAFAAGCFLWMEYLTQGKEGMERVWHQVILKQGREAPASSAAATGFILGGLQHEWLTTVYVRIISAHHATHRIPDRVFREPLLRTLETFPGNSFFLSQLAGSYAGASLGIGELRRYFDDRLSGEELVVDAPAPASAVSSALKKLGIKGSDNVEQLVWRADHSRPVRSPSLLVYLHAVSAELHRPGATHRIEALLERAVQVQASGRAGDGCYIVALWRLLLRVHCARNRPAEATKVLYRALQACPFSKDLWLDGIAWIYLAQETTQDDQQSPLPPARSSKSSSSVTLSNMDTLTDEQVSELYELLLEKEVRVRAMLRPEREADAAYQPVERAWDRHLRKQAEERAASEERRREREERRGKRGRSRSRTSSRSPDRLRRRSSSPSRSSRSSSAERWERQRRQERAPLPEGWKR